MAGKLKKWESIIVAFCAIGGLILGVWNILSPIFRERANIQIENVTITKLPGQNNEIVTITIFNQGKINARDVTIDIQLDIPISDYSIVSKEQYSIKWGGNFRNSLGLYFSELYGDHGITITLNSLQNDYLKNNSVEPTVKVYEGEYGLVASHYAPILYA